MFIIVSKSHCLKDTKTGMWLSDQLGKSEVTISRWASNASQPLIETLCIIAKLLQMDVSELLIKNDSNFDSH